MARYRESGNPRGLGHSLGSLAVALGELGRAAEADAALAESIAVLRRLNDHSSLANALGNRGFVEVERGRLAEAEATAGDMERAAGAEGAKLGLANAHDVRALAAAARGDLESARRHFAAARQIHVDNGDLDEAAETDVAHAVAEQAAGNPTVAWRLLDEGLQRLPGGGTEMTAAFYAEMLRARIDAEAGRLAAARRRLEARAGSERSPSVRWRLAFLRARAGLAMAESRFAAARPDLELASGLAEGAGRTLDALALRLDLAELAADAGDRPAAVTALEVAAPQAATLQLEALNRRAAALAQRLRVGSCR
ncbi:MAG TPA: hypothetical protein VGV61_17765 [Thermoanaerobaculia bacterium]|nr:hypothetical protein [Thermoanaerobaculia bacterium]